MRKGINNFISIVNILAATSLLFSYLTTYISPETTVFFSFFGLAYPVLLIVNLSFVVYWLFHRNKKVFISLVTFLIGISHFSQFFQIPINTSTQDSISGIKVMSYNVRLFDLYDWTKKKDIRGQIIDLVNENTPDIICFQEYYIKGNSKKLKNDLKMNYFYQYFTNESIKQGKKTGIGTAIFSKFKIINQGQILFEDEKSNHCSYVDVLKNKDTLRIYNAHLGSIRFDYDDYTFIAGEKSSEQKEGIALYKVLKRLSKGFKKRVGQIDQLLDHVNHSPFPTLVATDMNDTPISYSYKQFSSSLKDSFNEKGNWTGSTYIGSIPLLRIDYLWHNNQLENTFFETIDKEFSDHRPIIGSYQLLQ